MEKTAIEWFLDNIPTRYRNAFLNDCKEEIKKAKEVEEEREYQIKAIWYGIGINAGRTNKVAELRPWKKNDPRRDTLNEK